MYRAAIIGVLLFLVAGCGDSVDPKIQALDNQLATVVQKFEKAEGLFSASTNHDELIKNGYQLDRMIEAFQEVETIEKKAVAAGTEPLSELKSEIHGRLLKHLAQFKSDMNHINVMVDLKNAQRWLE